MNGSIAGDIEVDIEVNEHILACSSGELKNELANSNKDMHKSVPLNEKLLTHFASQKRVKKETDLTSDNRERVPPS